MAIQLANVTLPLWLADGNQSVTKFSPNESHLLSQRLYLGPDAMMTQCRSMGLPGVMAV